MDLKTYCKNKLTEECQAIRTSLRKTFHPELSECEKALIYKYSDDGYIELNAKLRANNGKNLTKFGKLLVPALEKIENYKSVVYRKVQISRIQQTPYKKALLKGFPVIEPALSSTSKIKQLALLFPGNTFFIINSKTGKDIEKIAKFGYGNKYNEYEVLLLPNRRFEVLEIDSSIKNLTTIILEEI